MADAILAQSGIYKITNTVNGKVYVGSAVNIKRRWRDHKIKLSALKHENSQLQRSWVRHGEGAFDFSVIEVVDDKSDLLTREQAWIDSICSDKKKTYNMCPVAGNCLGRKFSDETKRKLSASLKGKARAPEAVQKAKESNAGFKHSDETRARLSMIAKSRTPEHLAKIALAAKGHKASDATKLQMSESRRGRKVSDSARANISAGKKGLKRAPFSEEWRRNISLSQIGRVKSAETLEKMRIANIGKKMSPESIRKSSEAQRGKKLSPESIAKRQETRRANAERKRQDNA